MQGRDFDRAVQSLSRFAKFGLIVYVLILLSAAVCIGVIAWHFIAKFW
jgi:hypothetical protein